VSWIAADDVHDAAPTHDLALVTNTFDAGLNFHGKLDAESGPGHGLVHKPGLEMAGND
jgi:hypothetical protein